MARKKSNYFHKETTTTIDRDTGEHLSTEIIVRKRVSADKFFQVYTEDWAALMGIEGDCQFKIILWIGRNMNYETNEVILVMSIKKRIAKEIGFSYKSVENSISLLKKSGVLIHVDTSIYMLNPKMFFKGKPEDRQLLIRSMEYLIVSNDVVGVEDGLEE
jgi:hypothetical protein